MEDGPVEPRGKLPKVGQTDPAESLTNQVRGRGLRERELVESMVRETSFLWIILSINKSISPSEVFCDGNFLSKRLNREGEGSEMVE